jgi:hypothetical protein
VRNGSAGDTLNYMKPKSTSREDQFATVHDLKVWGGQLSLQIEDSKKELQEEMKGLRQELREDMTTLFKQFSKEITDHIDAAIELKADERLGARADRVRIVQDKVENHEERIQVLEQR